MVDNFCTSIGLPVSPPDRQNFTCALLVTLLGSVSAADLFAQTPSAAAAPSDAAAAAGMTSGMSETPSYRDLQMMQVRTAAQSAQGDAAAASMSRSADRTLEEQNRERALAEARKTKALKRDAANRMRWERSSNAFNKVSLDQMSSWKANGGVRVERNVPDPFLISLIQEEEMLAARQAAEAEANSGPLKKAFGWVPFVGDDSPSSSGVTVPTSNFSSSDDGGGGLFSKVRLPSLPKLPSVGNGGGADNGATESGNAGSGEPSFAPSTVSSRSAAPRPAPAASTAVKPGSVPRISGAELVDGKPQVQRSMSTSEPAFAGAPSSPSVQPSSTEMPGQEKEERGGLFSMLKSGGSSSSGGGGGLFSFGKKKSGGGGDVQGVDGSLFPDNSVNDTPRGGQLSGGYTVDDVSQDVSFASDTGSVELPGQEQEKTRSGFSLPKPNLSLPNIPKLERSSDGGGAGVPTNSVINSAGTNVYQVTETAQFMVYGEDRMQSEVRALSAGTIVRMTKAGDQWASIQLSDGTEGIIKNESLRPAQ